MHVRSAHSKAPTFQVVSDVIKGGSDDILHSLSRATLFGESKDGKISQALPDQESFAVQCCAVLCQACLTTPCRS